MHGELPIPVERLADAKLGIDIVDTAGLEAAGGLLGLLAVDGRTIHLDGSVGGERMRQRRMIIAHETGHHQLHRAWYDRIRTMSPGDLEAFQALMGPDVIRRLNWQAEVFGQCLLVPSAALIAAVQAAEWRVSRFRALELGDEFERARVIAYVTDVLQVPGGVIESRGRMEGLWPGRDRLLGRTRRVPETPSRGVQGLLQGR
jgi:hypothetical protein